MPYTVHDPQPFFAAILARIAASTGKNVGLVQAPNVTPTVYPYAVVDPLVDDSSEGALNDPTQAVTWAWLVRCFSNGPDGAQVMQRMVRTALHGFTPTVAGVGTTPIELDLGSGIIRDDSVQPPLWFSADRFIALTSI